MHHRPHQKPFRAFSPHQPLIIQSHTSRKIFFCFTKQSNYAIVKTPIFITKQNINGDKFRLSPPDKPDEASERKKRRREKTSCENCMVCMWKCSLDNRFFLLSFRLFLIKSGHVLAKYYSNNQKLKWPEKYGQSAVYIPSGFH